MKKLKTIFYQKKNKRIIFLPVKGNHGGSFAAKNTDYGQIQAENIDILATIRDSKNHTIPFTKDELRLKKYNNKKHAAILFVVDSSFSQGAKRGCHLQRVR